MSRRIIITINDDCISKIHAISQEIEECEVRIDSVMETLGVISAVTDLTDISKIKKISGVLSVEDQLVLHRL